MQGAGGEGGDADGVVDGGAGAGTGEGEGVGGEGHGGRGHVCGGEVEVEVVFEGKGRCGWESAG